MFAGQASFSRCDMNVTLVVYNILGQRVVTLVNEKQAPGFYLVKFKAMSLSSGIYFYSINVNGNYRVVKKMILTE